MGRGSTRRAGAFGFAFSSAIAACAPLALELTVGDGGSQDATTGDVNQAEAGVDASVADSGSSVDAVGDQGGDTGSPDADAQGAPPPMPCAKPADCTMMTTARFCDEEAGVCVQCRSSSDCNGNAPHCVNNLCIACETTADCGDASMVCNTHIPRCANACTSGGTCLPMGLICSPLTGYCVECEGNDEPTADSYCVDASTGAYCYVPAGVCGCRSNADCPSSSAPTCGPVSATGNRFCQ
jgi:hypothetical protein